MLRLLERSIAAVEERLVLLAPPQAVLPETFENVVADPVRRSTYIQQMQTVRGEIYLSEGNVAEHQLQEGRHQTPEDERSWHLLMTDAEGHVSSCAWYLEHDNHSTLDDLRIKHCPLAKNPDWSDKLEQAVAAEIGRARRFKLAYAEVGGWAVSKARRCSSEGLVLALAAYGLSRILGGCIGITTANVTHASSSILRRLGGSFLHLGKEQIPSYFDVRYNTRIELLRFDSRKPAAKYLDLIEGLRERLSNVRVIAGFKQAEMLDQASLDDTGPIDVPASAYLTA